MKNTIWGPMSELGVVMLESHVEQRCGLCGDAAWVAGILHRGRVLRDGDRCVGKGMYQLRGRETLVV